MHRSQQFGCELPGTTVTIVDHHTPVATYARKRVSSTDVFCYSQTAGYVCMYAMCCDIHTSNRQIYLPGHEVCQGPAGEKIGLV